MKMSIINGLLVNNLIDSIYNFRFKFVRSQFYMSGVAYDNAESMEKG